MGAIMGIIGIVGFVGFCASGVKSACTPRWTADQSKEYRAMKYYPNDPKQREQFLREVGHSKYKNK